MLKRIYKRILRKLHLPTSQLERLKTRLTINNISSGPFIKEGKMCPNTNALAMKLSVETFTNSKDVRKQLNQNGVTNTELCFFYLLFDMPAITSKTSFRNVLSKLRTAVDELILEKSE